MNTPSSADERETFGAFRKKPLVIEAYRFNNYAGSRGDRPRWLTDAVDAGAVWFQGGEKPYLTIRTLEGDMRADHGDWIIKGVKGELYPCKPDIFDTTYDRASLGAAQVPALKNYLESIYAFLCSVAPEGIADEAFRDIPESLLGDSARSRLVAQESSKRADSGTVRGFPQSDRCAGKEVGCPVGSTSAGAAQVPSLSDEGAFLVEGVPLPPLPSTEFMLRSKAGGSTTALAYTSQHLQCYAAHYGQAVRAALSQPSQPDPAHYPCHPGMEAATDPPAAERKECRPIEGAQPSQQEPQP